MKIDISDVPIGDSTWSKQWNARRNAAVSDLIESPARELPPDADREDLDDQIARSVFHALRRRYAADSDATYDARLYEAVNRAINDARDDERKRFSRAISRGLKAMLGDDFSSVMYDIAYENEINIGRD